jgi:hypothetical protein
MSDTSAFPVDAQRRWTYWRSWTLGLNFFFLE